ncbi:MAG TPA: hypothetical protein VF721_20555 [Pyrinomonadaceae bacterium]
MQTINCLFTSTLVQALKISKNIVAIRIRLAVFADGERVDLKALFV